MLNSDSFSKILQKTSAQTAILVAVFCVLLVGLIWLAPNPQESVKQATIKADVVVVADAAIEPVLEQDIIKQDDNDIEVLQDSHLKNNGFFNDLVSGDLWGGTLFQETVDTAQSFPKNTKQSLIDGDLGAAAHGFNQMIDELAHTHDDDVQDAENILPSIIAAGDGVVGLEEKSTIKIVKTERPQVKISEKQAHLNKEALKSEKRIYATDSGERPKIAIVIDDLGMNYGRLKELSSIRSPLTLAFLPYAKNLKDQTSYARLKGHELIVHMPMLPKSDTINPGPIVLTPDMTADQIRQTLEKGLEAFDGYVGINNHMGSAFTENYPAMRVVASELKKRGLYFLDSRTTSISAGARASAYYDLPYIGRDIFLDHYDTSEFINKQLRATERAARKNGHAIAIGHPYLNTIEALEKWLPTLEAKGFDLVSVSDLIKQKKTLKVSTKQISNK